MLITTIKIPIIAIPVFIFVGIKIWKIIYQVLLGNNTCKKPLLLLYAAMERSKSRLPEVFKREKQVGFSDSYRETYGNVIVLGKFVCQEQLNGLNDVRKIF